MAATERGDRNGVDRMLSRMRSAGEIVSAGRGIYTLPDSDPLSAGQIGQKGASEDVPDAQDADPADVSAPDESDCGSDRDLTDAETGQIASQIAEPAKPLTNNGKPNGSDHLTDLTGIQQKPDPWEGLDVPDNLRRAPREVPPDRRPALGPPGDSLDDM
jgi:hypothetical protein